MSDTVQLALITGAFTFAGLALNRLIGHLEYRSTSRQVAAVKMEITTGNAQTMAQLADRAETRRIDKVPLRDRTMADEAHMISMTKDS